MLLMNDILITTLVAVNIFLSPVVPNALPIEKPEVRVEKKVINWTVKPSESLSGVALIHYGNENHWTTIWVDNSWIENPYKIEEGWELKLRLEKPDKPIELPAELKKKYLSINTIAEVVVDNSQPVIEVTASSNAQGPLNENQIQFLGNCESGMTASRNSGNGYYGAFQFAQGTWNRMETGYARADMAPLEIQKDAVQRLVSKSSIFGQFPACSRRMRTLGLI